MVSFKKTFMGLAAGGFSSSCREQGLLIAVASPVVAPKLSSCGTGALRHVGSSQSRDGTSDLWAQ